MYLPPIEAPSHTLERLSGIETDGVSWTQNSYHICYAPFNHEMPESHSNPTLWKATESATMSISRDKRGRQEYSTILDDLSYVYIP
jgi:hypothetical protein